MTVQLPKPVKVRRGSLEVLPRRYRKAAENASDCLPIEGDEPVRIEVYKTEDIRLLVEKVWHWSATLSDLDPARKQDDIARVMVIMKLLRDGAARWPYVSYWADTFEELWETEDDDGEVSVPNHGDGWHRIIAAVELGLPTIEIMFLE